MELRVAPRRGSGLHCLQPPELRLTQRYGPSEYVQEVQLPASNAALLTRATYLLPTFSTSFHSTHLLRSPVRLKNKNKLPKVPMTLLRYKGVYLLALRILSLTYCYAPEVFLLSFLNGQGKSDNWRRQRVT